MMFCTPWTVASCPDSGMGLRPFAFSVATTAPAMPSFAATTPWMLLLVWTSICSKIVWALAASHSGTNFAGPFLIFLVLEERVQDVVVAALEPERVRVGRAAPELRDRAVRLVRAVLLHGAEDAERLLATHVVPVERDVDGAGAADDLAVVVDRLAAHCGELLLDGDRGAAVEVGDDADLRSQPRCTARPARAASAADPARSRPSPARFAFLKALTNAGLS